jgi:hypothetical protein
MRPLLWQTMSTPGCLAKETISCSQWSDKKVIRTASPCHMEGHIYSPVHCPWGQVRLWGGRPGLFGEFSTGQGSLVGHLGEEHLGANHGRILPHICHPPLCKPPSGCDGPCLQTQRFRRILRCSLTGASVGIEKQMKSLFQSQVWALLSLCTVLF